MTSTDHIILNGTQDRIDFEPIERASVMAWPRQRYWAASFAMSRALTDSAYDNHPARRIPSSGTRFAYQARASSYRQIERVDVRLSALSSLQFRAQLPGPAGGPAHPPFGSLGTPRCPGKCCELPSPALLLGLRQRDRAEDEPGPGLHVLQGQR